MLTAPISVIHHRDVHNFNWHLVIVSEHVDLVHNDSVWKKPAKVLYTVLHTGVVHCAIACGKETKSVWLALLMFVSLVKRWILGIFELCLYYFCSVLCKTSAVACNVITQTLRSLQHLKKCNF